MDRESLQINSLSWTTHLSRNNMPTTQTRSRTTWWTSFLQLHQLTINNIFRTWMIFLDPLQAKPLHPLSRSRKSMTHSLSWISSIHSSPVSRHLTCSSLSRTNSSLTPFSSSSTNNSHSIINKPLDTKAFPETTHSQTWANNPPSSLSSTRWTPEAKATTHSVRTLLRAKHSNNKFKLKNQAQLSSTSSTDFVLYSITSICINTIF